MRLFWGRILVTKRQKRLLGPKNIFNLVLYSNFKDINFNIKLYQADNCI